MARAGATGPAVTVAFAKRAGANAVVVADSLVKRLDTLKGKLIPSDVSVEVTRDYGKTANDKANELLFHLALATISIVLLIGFAIGWREAGVTLIVIPTTILLTLFAANVMGYTINRVSLFALIFSIGILVDDAIVVVENIARHWAMDDQRTRMQAAIEAVAEVGNPDCRGHAHGGCRAAADAVRLRHDGPLYGADPGQCLGGDAVLLLRRHGDRALGASEVRRQGHGRAIRRASHRRPAGRALPAHRHAHRALRSKSAKRFLLYVALATVAVCMLFVTETRDGQASALRQQIRARSDDGSAGGRDRRGHRRRRCSRPRARPRNCPRSSRSRSMPARPRRSISTVWCGTIICAPSRRWASCRSISMTRPIATAKAMPSRSICASGWTN